MHDGDHDDLVGIFVGLSYELGGLINYLFTLRGTIFPYQECNIIIIITSGNRTPGSRFYFDLWIPPFASTSSYSKAPGCLYNFMRLRYARSN